MKPVKHQETTDIVIALIVVALALLFILVYTFSENDPLFFGNDSTKVKVDSQPFILDEVIYVPIQLEKNTEIVEENIEDTYSSSESFIADTSIIRTKLVDNTNSLNQASQVKEPIIRRFTFPIDSINVDSIEILQGTNLDENVSSDDRANKCVIIIGTFRNQRNAEKLKDKLENSTYSIFYNETEGHTKVGIYENCNSNILSTTLDIVRKEFASDAVIYEPIE